jgi:hypothetical protein
MVRLGPRRIAEAEGPKHRLAEKGWQRMMTCREREGSLLSGCIPEALGACWPQCERTKKAHPGLLRMILGPWEVDRSHQHTWDPAEGTAVVVDAAGSRSYRHLTRRKAGRSLRQRQCIREHQFQDI